LRRLTEESTGLPVIVGEAEGSTLGNFAVQLAAGASERGLSGEDFQRRVRVWAARLAPDAG